MTDTTPYIKSERHFKLYEPYIIDVVTAWPSLVIFTPKPPHASIETLSTRIRICIRALRDAIQRNSGWTHNINEAKFLQCCDEITVSTSVVPGKVVCGPYDLVCKKTPQGQPVAETVSGSVQDRVEFMPAINVVDPSVELVNALLVMHHHRLLLNPSTVQFTTSSELQRVDVGMYDVAIDHDVTTNTFTII